MAKGAIAQRLIAAIALLMLPAVVTHAQPPAPEAPRRLLNDLGMDPAEQLFPGCATLRTDTESHLALSRADESIAVGRPDLAAALWQKILDESGDLLVAEEVLQPLGPTAKPLVIYRPLREHVERRMMQAPAALAAYRTSADAEASAILAAASSENDEQALSKVVRRFFLSSQGDDAAFKLASLALDRHDFVVAERLLRQLLNHPNLNVPKSQIFARLAVSAAHLQDRDLATRSLEQLRAASDSPPASFVELIKAEVANALAANPADTSSTGYTWPMAFGDAARSGSMPSLDPAKLAGPLSELWTYDYAAPTPETGPVAAGLPSVSREELIRKWQLGGWRPTGRLLFDANRVYLKSAERLSCFGTTEIGKPLWQSAWENRYELDDVSRQYLMHTSDPRLQLNQANAPPNSLPDIWMFGDRVQQSMAIADGVIYTIEGHRATAAPRREVEHRQSWGSIPHRSRSNWLTAYQTAGGKAIWTRTAVDEDNTITGEMGFLAAPTPVGEQLLVPVTDGGAISLLSLDRATGKTLWRTFLCDEPQSAASPWAEVVIAAEGGEAYLTCSCGVAFAVDIASGGICWADRYSRSTAGNPNRPRAWDSEAPGTRFPNGWDDDVAILHGRLLVVLPSDSDQLLAFDRRSGQRVWESPRTPPLGQAANYCLGVQGDGLFVAGKNIVRKYSLTSGRLLAEKTIGDSHGRGCLTDSEVLIPVKETIQRFDLNLDQPRSIAVSLLGHEPVGNLFSDGQRLWAVGAGRVYALTTLETRLQQLADLISAGNGQAQLARMRLHLNQNRVDLALADLRGAYQLLAKESSATEAAHAIFTAIWEQKLAQSEPAAILALLTDLNNSGAKLSVLSAEARQRQHDLLTAALGSIRQHRPTGTATALLQAVDLLDQDYLLNAATVALDSAISPNDVRTLLKALDTGSPQAKVISMRSAARLAPTECKPRLKALLGDPDNRVQLAAAKTLITFDERTGVLETLLKLLDSPSAEIRTRSQNTLQSLTGQHIPFAPEGSPGDRAASIRTWRKWIDSQGASAILARPRTDRSALLGRILLTSPTQLVELDVNRQERGRIPLPGSAWGCQGLPNGNRLVAINSHAMVIEYDDAGREVWRKDRLPAPPTSVQRLDSGSTLIACGNTQQVVEVAPDGTTTVIEVPGHPISAQRLESGNTLVALQDAQRVVEVNSRGRILSEINTGSLPIHAVRLENGNTLITLPQARKVIEYDAPGKSIVWTTAVPLLNPYAAERLANGNTLVTDHTGLQEIDPTGKRVVWSFRHPQAMGLSSF